MDELPSPPPCPKCGEGRQVRFTIKTDSGRYCVCDRCGHVWHAELARDRRSWIESTSSPKKPE
jgi:uncharacterized Zn finger protein